MRVLQWPRCAMTMACTSHSGSGKKWLGWVCDLICVPESAEWFATDAADAAVGTGASVYIQKHGRICNHIVG